MTPGGGGKSYFERKITAGFILQSFSSSILINFFFRSFVAHQSGIQNGVSRARADRAATAAGVVDGQGISMRARTLQRNTRAHGTRSLTTVYIQGDFCNHARPIIVVEQWV